MNKSYKLAGARPLSEERMAEISGIVKGCERSDKPAVKRED